MQASWGLEHIAVAIYTNQGGNHCRIKTVDDMRKWYYVTFVTLKIYLPGMCS